MREKNGKNSLAEHHDRNYDPDKNDDPDKVFTSLSILGFEVEMLS